LAEGYVFCRLLIIVAAVSVNTLDMKERVLTIVSVLFLLFSMGGCKFKKGDTPLFKDAAIQDSLLSFLERIDSIPNSYGAPSLYAVSFWLDGQDSLIRFSANAALWEYSTFEIDTADIEFDESFFDFSSDNSDYNMSPPPMPVDSVITTSPNWTGLYRYGNKHVLVESDWDPSTVIYMSALEPWEAFERMYHYKDPMSAPDCDLTHYRYHCYRTYRYQSPNNVRLIRRRIGQADPDFKTYPETIEYKELAPKAPICWEDFTAEKRESILEQVNPLISDYYAGRFTASDDERTENLLNLLTSQQKDKDIRALYFSVFNQILMSSDGALAEMLGPYSIKMVCEEPEYILTYLCKNKALEEEFIHSIGTEIYLSQGLSTDDGASLGALKRSILSKTKDKGLVEPFLSHIESFISSLKE
jgi:hypothetical protein